MENIELYVSIVLNIILIILTYVFKRKSMVLGRKLEHVVKLINDFIEAYKDKVITPNEADMLIKDVLKIYEDP